jgi:hypothetical protein
LIIFLTLTRLVVVIIFENFSFALFTPPLGDFHYRTVSGAPGPYMIKLATLGFLQERSAIIHRTVRCATELSGATAEQRLLAQRSTAKAALTALR